MKHFYDLYTVSLRNLRFWKNVSPAVQPQAISLVYQHKRILLQCLNMDVLWIVDYF